MKENVSERFGKNLKAIREFLGLSQQRLAEMTKLTPAAISQIENGLREPGFKTIVILLKELNVTFERMLK